MNETLDAAVTRIELLEVALREARDDMAGWIGYAAPYFQWKHDARASLDKITAILEDDYDTAWLPGPDDHLGVRQ
jgi:hypothetical protein